MANVKSKFYSENQEYVEDVINFFKNASNEFIYIMKEIGGSALQFDFLYIGMVPFAEGEKGIMIGSDGRTKYQFECDDIRAEIGERLPAYKSICDFESKNRHLYESEELNIKKCDVYYKNKVNFPFVRRYSGLGKDSVKLEEKVSKVVEDSFHKKLFVSKWIEYGPFCVFLVSGINNELLDKYIILTNTIEEEGPYKYFLNALIDNFYEKWLEDLYYGLNYSTNHFIADSQALITASANDVFQSREIPSEHIFNKIANIKYEGVPCNGKIVFTRNVNHIVALSWGIPIKEENVKQIRKFLEMSNEKTCLV